MNNRMTDRWGQAVVGREGVANGRALAVLLAAAVWWCVGGAVTAAESQDQVLGDAV